MSITVPALQPSLRKGGSLPMVAGTPAHMMASPTPPVSSPMETDQPPPSPPAASPSSAVLLPSPAAGSPMRPGPFPSTPVGVDASATGPPVSTAAAPPALLPPDTGGPLTLSPPPSLLSSVVDVPLAAPQPVGSVTAPDPAPSDAFAAFVATHVADPDPTDGALSPTDPTALLAHERLVDGLDTQLTRARHTLREKATRSSTAAVDQLAAQLHSTKGKGVEKFRTGAKEVARKGMAVWLGKVRGWEQQHVHRNGLGSVATSLGLTADRLERKMQSLVDHSVDRLAYQAEHAGTNGVSLMQRGVKSLLQRAFTDLDKSMGKRQATVMKRIKTGRKR